MQKQKRIQDMTAEDKAEFLESTVAYYKSHYGMPWPVLKAKMQAEIDAIFDDAKFAKMDAESRIDAAYARAEFGDKKPEIVDYMQWMSKFVTRSDVVTWSTPVKHR